MAVVTKTIIYLGQAAEIDTVEAGGRFRGGENTKAVLGKKYSADKSDAQLIEVGFNDVNNNDILEEDTVYDSHGRVAGHHAETLRYDLGDGPVETTLDFTAFARVTIKLNGGGSHKVTAGLLQGDNGALFLEELTGAPRSLDNLDIKWIKINALDHVNTQGDGYLSTDSSVTNTTVCYCEGTLIHTASGDVAVEELAEGDMLITDQGAQVPVKWIGRQTLSSRFGAPERLMPVRFAAGSLG
ncbi:MAG: Hint domain-containing protein [Marinibacterium sp.]|nr:Hint domain-containing protein [Marinibacterium sp.]